MTHVAEVMDRQSRLERESLLDRESLSKAPPNGTREPSGAVGASFDADVVERVRCLTAAELPKIVEAIDEGFYPAALMRGLGEAGAWRTHLLREGSADLSLAIQSMAVIGEQCGSTAFMGWCQDTLVWYVVNSDNAALRQRLLAAVACGQVLGGTGLSNPMKSFFGIESLKLKGRRVDGGYVVRGSLPWVSNLGPDHCFGTIFEVEGTGEKVMFVADCGDAKVALHPCEPFLAMDGTGTYAVQFRDAFVPDDLILAHAALPFVRKVRAGFVLLQCGMALGLIRDCTAIMQETRRPLGHINRYLEEQPEDFTEKLDRLDAEVMALATTPYDGSDDYWRRVLSVRLEASELSLAAASAAMLHCGARGYVRKHRAQRRLREAYFVAIVTPATKQLRKMLADLAA